MYTHNNEPLVSLMMLNGKINPKSGRTELSLLGALIDSVRNGIDNLLEGSKNRSVDCQEAMLNC